MTSEDLTSRVFEPAREYIQSALESGEITASDDLADSLADVLHTATQKHLAEYRKPLYARDIVGRMYSTASAREYLNLTQEELDRLVEDHLILKLTDGKGRNGYPAFQFKNGAVRPEIQKLVKTHLTFPSPIDPTQPLRTPWEVAHHLTTRCLLHGGYSISDYLTKYPEKVDEENNLLLLSLNTTAAML